MTFAISTNQLNKSYGPNHILKGLTLDVIQGETLVILGRSGVGKSVLLRLLMGLEEVDHGTIMIEGVNQTELSEKEKLLNRSRMGMLFQGAALFDSLTVAENIAFALGTRLAREVFGDLNTAQINERVDHALELVGLSGTQYRMPSDLSGGMKKRAALARLVAYRPKILLYDEPTTGLDPITSMQISELICTMQKELGATSIVITHDIPSALKVSNRLALHHEGQIAYIAEKATFIQSDHPLVQQFLKFSSFNSSSSSVPTSPLKGLL
jgi:phospholipid/cholesterol/gamma-HCH transport system ATP-binding protein